jgi:radical SAM superfamily enzyme YgiQ (UPF0313 family)
MRRPHRIALVCMTPPTDASEMSDLSLPSFGVRRILAAVVADRERTGARVALFDGKRPDVEAFVESIEAFEPDLVGFSAYVWSTPCLVEVARRLKRRRPERAVVFGGPSARTAVFDLPPYGAPHAFLDALVESDGEEVFRDVVRLSELSRAALESVPGLVLPAPDGWRRTPPRPAIRALDGIPSPYQLGLMRDQEVAYLETYRGCPFSCAFCEWGASDPARSAFSADYLERELRAFEGLRAPAVCSIDAGLNLNARAFRNLCEAESRVGFLRTARFWSEVYPSHLREEHLAFLASVRATFIGVGLQSSDARVLAGLGRPFDVRRLETVVQQLSGLGETELQIIFGLPGDSPEGFRRTLDFARSMRVAVRAYHCLVLPDALLTRSRPEWQIRFDPTTHEMLSCSGWSAEDLLATRAWISEEALAARGAAGRYWWYFPRAAGSTPDTGVRQALSG